MTAGSKSRDPRQERLAQALRDNLKRRKAQIRGRALEAEDKAEDGQGAPGEAPGQKA